METIGVKKDKVQSKKEQKGQFKDEKSFLLSKQKRFDEVFGKVNWNNVK